ncbi:VOC family protein [Brachybacterium sp. AOP42-E1-35]|uniref:VOC family protein n=1 Tax=Brachybacterium sp. AOP42-E1-35 TaxID=3457664 RepID=UPI00402AFD4D
MFGWTSEDWSEYAGAPYFGLTTGTGSGIDGAVLGRPGGANPEVGGPVAGGVLTMGVADHDEIAAKILAAGGTEALPKHALPGMAWQGYFHDTENNVFGLHQPDPEAA